MKVRTHLILLFLLAVIFFPPAGAPGTAEAGSDYKRSIERYTLPDVTLINQEGKKVNFLALVNSGKPVVLDFIYGTCTTICPVLSASFVNFQNRLGADSTKAQLISISIDPDNDTPAVMKKYLKNYRSKPGWDFLSGSRKDIDKVMNGFDAYISNKMSHYPIMFMRAPGSDQWVRIYGLIGSSDFMKEYERTMQK
jgi:protein SCO1/2